MASSADIFQSIVVQPTWRDGQALVRWQVADPYRGCGILVARSIDGIEFKLLNPNSDLIFSDEFLDTDIPRGSRLTEIFYQLAVELPDGTLIKGQPVSASGVINRKQFATAQMMIRRLWEHLQVGNGIPMWHFAPLTSGERNPKFDPDVWMQAVIECPHDLDASYGLPFKGGYAPPILTRVKLESIQTNSQEEANGERTAEVKTAQAWLPCYPRPAATHFMVNPFTDERWALAPSIKPFSFLGMIPIKFAVTLVLLHRTDTRYRIPVPPIQIS